MMSKININGFQEVYRYKDMLFITDSFFYPSKNKVMPVFDDEQIVFLENLKLKKKESVLDLGSGCGILGIYAAKKGCEVTAVDINTRALEFTRFNSLLNNVESNMTVLKSNYFAKIPKSEKFDVILANPPFHPTPPGVNVSKHAFAGARGLSKAVFILTNSKNYLKKNGRLCLVVMSVGTGEEIEIVRQAKKIYGKKVRVRVHHIFPRIKYSLFLKNVYGTSFVKWQKSQMKKYSHIYYILFSLEKNKTFKLTETYNKKEFKRTKINGDWKARFRLHKIINNQLK